MKYLIANFKYVSIGAFISSWSSQYKSSEKKELRSLYKKNIKLKRFTSFNLEELFAWKNGIVSRDGAKVKMSKTKRKFLNNVLKHREDINELKSKWDIVRFDEIFKPTEHAAIWNSFLMHIIRPNEYPIFDQHVYRSFYYLKTDRVQELKGSNKKRTEIYREDYLPFFLQIKGKSKKRLKSVDEAMWAFGKFLKSYYQLIA